MTFLAALPLVAFLTLSPVTAAKTASVPAWWETVVQDKKLPVDRMQTVLSAACSQITQKALKPVTASSFAMDAVKSLSTIDQDIEVVKNGKRVLISANGKILKSFAAPDESDCENWSRLILAAMVTARPFSPKASLTNEEGYYDVFINAALGNLDSYSHYASPDPVELKPLKKPAGIGVSYRRIGKYLEITEILPASAAAEADIEIGDRISAIDGKKITDLSQVETLNALRGEAGTDVTLTLRRSGKTTHRILKRKAVLASPVSYYFDETEKLMTIKIQGFTPRTLTALKATLKLARDYQAKALILDLRGNMGGLLKEAVLSADLFLPPDFPMISTKGRFSQTDQRYTSTEKDRRPVYPIVIMTDAKTASSAEFFTGVLQEYRHAVVIGTPTYGKGVVQMNETLPNGGELYVTWARYMLPSGYSPQTYGIYPNICTSGRTIADIDTKIPAPQTHLKPFYTGTDTFRKKAITYCPKQSRGDNTLDDELARRLLNDPAYYERALSYFSLDSVQK